MTDIIKTPSGQIPQQTPATPALVSADAALVARKVEIERLPLILEKIAQTVRIEAEVIRQNIKTGEVVLKTPQGEITIKADPPIPQGVQRVVVDIPPGNPAQNAVLYLARTKTDVAVKAVLPLPEPLTPAAVSEKLPVLEKGVVISVLEIETPDIPPSLVKYPPEVIKKIIETIWPDYKPVRATEKADVTPVKTMQPPDVDVSKIKTAIEKSVPAQSPVPPAASLVEDLPPANTPDTNLIEILQAQIRAKVTHLGLRLADIPLGSGIQKPAFNPVDLLPAEEEPHLNVPAQTDKQMPPEIASKNIKILDILPPGKQMVMPPQPDPQKPAAEAGKIIGLSPAGQPILALKDGLMILQTSSNLPVGSQVIYQPEPEDELTPPPEFVLKPHGKFSLTPFDPLTAKTWPALDDAIQVLNALAPEAAANVKNAIPSASPKLVPTVLFFIAAVRLGQIENWLGEKSLDALKTSGRRDIAEQLGRDFSKLSSELSKPLAGDWRLISVPLMHEDYISNLNFYVRHSTEDESDGAEQGKKVKTTRFILSLSLSKIGDMQMDGYLKKDKLDMILRTKDRLPSDIRQQITEKFNLGLGYAHLTGTMSFQAGAQNWFTVARAAEQGTKVVV